MTDDAAPLVSVVTPVYNGERYLRRCIESVLGQTYWNWHYVIVDNCSTDNSFTIAQEYAARDCRIRVQRNDTFVRVIANYNIAFRQVSTDSKYTKVVAADDWLFPECLERMVEFAEAHPTVAIVAAHQLCGTGVAWEGVPHPRTVVPGLEAGRAELLGGPHVFGTATTVLYRSDIVTSRHEFFNESNLHADTEACLEFLAERDFGFVHQILTFNHREEGSLSSFSQRMWTYFPSFIHHLNKYGPVYLTPRELQARSRKHRVEYYRALGKAVLQRRDAEFWRYHTEHLSRYGQPLSRMRLTVAVVGWFLDIVLNPKSSIEKLLLRRRARRAEGSIRELEEKASHV